MEVKGSGSTLTLSTKQMENCRKLIIHLVAEAKIAGKLEEQEEDAITSFLAQAIYRNVVYEKIMTALDITENDFPK